MKKFAKVFFKAALMTALILSLFCCSVFAVDSSDALLAFPGAEGGGKYTKGARGALDEGGTIEVYHVTTLDSTGEGSFYEAIQADTSADNGETAPVGRIIVFDVGGVIDFPSGQKIDRDYVTILGQTAPGDGITLTGSDLQLGNGRENIIIRYMRFRPTDDTGEEADALGGQWNKDVIIDHCSASWCIDECLTLYAGSAESTTYEQGQRLTVQNTISSESLRMSNHFKGAHGYGGILGGTNATYYRNLFAHHDSRSPRLDRVLQKTDFRNNIVYNWGVTNSAYGAEPVSPHSQILRPSQVNYANNYYKFGPSTVSGKRYRIFDFSSMAKTVDDVTYKSEFYMEDNYVYGSTSATNNNWVSDAVNSAADQVERMTEPFSLGDDTYSDLNIADEDLLAGADVLEILDDVGATLPKRDNIDARVVADVVNQTGRIINKDEEVGEFTGIESSERVFEVPEDWKAENGLIGKDDTYIIEDGEFTGYTVIEAYVNEWTEEQSVTAPTNPTVTVSSPAIAAMNGTSNKSKWKVMTDSETLNYKASAEPVGDTKIVKMELYDGEELLKTYEAASADSDCVKITAQYTDDNILNDVSIETVPVSEATEHDNSGTEKVFYWDSLESMQPIDVATTMSIDDEISLDVGTHYLTCLAYNDLGESTRSDTSIVYVNGSDMPEGWTLKQIGTPSYSGSGAVSYDSESGLYTMGGSGKIGSTADKCDFMYTAVSGDFDISLKIEDVPKNENGAVFGLMVRESLDANSIMASLVDGWIKYGRNDRIVARSSKGGSIMTDSDNTNSTDNKMGIFMKTTDGTIVSGNLLGEHEYADTGTYSAPNYLRIQRSGDMLIFSVSDSGTDWTDNSRQPYEITFSGLAETLYVGVAIDSQQGQSDASPQLYYSMAQFSELNLSYDSNYEPTPTATPEPTVNPDSYAKYEDWNVGNATSTGTDGSAEVAYKAGKDALWITKRNVYKTFEEAISSGTVEFDFDIYMESSIPRNFRVYLENTESTYTITDNIFAEVINNDGASNSGGMVNYGPAISTSSGEPVLFDASALESSGWVHFDMLIDYSKSGTDEFISLTATDESGNTLGSCTMGSIDGINNSLKSIRLVQTATSVYFADMTVTVSE